MVQASGEERGRDGGGGGQREAGIRDPVHLQIKFVMPGIRWARSQRLIQLIKL